MKMMEPMDGSKMAMSKYDYLKTVIKLKQAINENELMVIHEIDGQAMLKMAGVESGPMGQIFFGKPDMMAKIMKANDMAMIQLPMKIILMEKDGMVMVRYFLPSTLLKQYKGTEEIAKMMDGTVTKIVESVTK